MSDMITPTAVTTTLPPGGGGLPTTKPADTPRRQRSIFLKALQVIASLRLTVVLFSLSLVLVFVGTLAMKEIGIWTAVGTYFRSFFVWVPFQVFFPSRTLVSGGFPFVGGRSIGAVLLVNVLAAHIVRFRYTWKRTGIVLIHVGIIVLMIGELVTGVYANEGFLTVLENQAINYVELHDNYEIAFVAPKDEKADHHIVVPVALLRDGKRFHNATVPFDIQMKRYMVNSTTENTSASDEDNPASAGIGTTVKVRETKEVSGANSKGVPNFPSAYITLFEQGTDKVVGTYLVTMCSRFDTRAAKKQLVASAETKYELSLRNKRSYKPYTIYLEKFTHGTHDGTLVPRDFRSTIELRDPEQGVERKVEVFMNNPLRYRGETFYQSGVEGLDEGTVLQVVRNPGWLLPYASCILVGIGMLVHFGAHPPNIPTREGRRVIATLFIVTAWLILVGAIVASWVRTLRSPGRGYIPLIAVHLGVLLLVRFMMAPGESANEPNIYEFGTTPVREDGRLKPFDSWARQTLFAISDRQTAVDDKESRITAVQWALDVMSHQPGVDEYPIFRITNDQVLSMLGFQPREGFRYSWAEIEGFDKESKKATTDQEREAIMAQRERRWNRIVAEVEQAREKDEEQRDRYDEKLLEFAGTIKRFKALRSFSEPALLPPEKAGQDWSSLDRVILGVNKKTGLVVDPARPTAKLFMEVLTAYQTVRAVRDGQSNDEAVGRFNRAVVSYKAAGDQSLSEKVQQRLGLEIFFNHFEPFYVCTLLYSLVFIVTCVSWVSWPEAMRASAFWLALTTLLVHTWALFARMYLMDRPLVFVTNLYSSAIFIGWGAVIMGLILERMFRNSVGAVVSSVAGALSLIVAHNIATGDTLNVLVAVLDTNFWLATHVSCVTIGYAATFVSGLLGAVFILRGLLTATLTRPEVKSLGQMIYGIVCFAMFFSFVGTVLGGIWADQSWGRFWGWDPKENGALLIVIWNALILHARWGGMVQQRGMAVLAVGGNIVTSWSWFGTNMLGIGLHSYGFMEGAALWLVVFVGANLALIGVGSLPLSMWRSYNESVIPPNPVVPPAHESKPRGKGKKGSAIQPA